MKSYKINFYGRDLLVVVDDQDKPWVSISHVCEGIGIDSYTQRKKLIHNQQVIRGQLMLVPSSKGEQQTFCIPFDRVNFWLGGISYSKVKPELKEKLIQYQVECAEVLHEHFQMKTPSDSIEGISSAILNRLDRIETRIQMMDAIFGDDSKEIAYYIQEIARIEGVDGRSIWGDVQVACDVASYKKLGRKILNYLKNRKDGSGLKLCSEESNKIN